jgi:hypothetical protein
MRLDKDVVGVNVEHIAIDNQVLIPHGDMVIRDFHTAEYFRLGCKWVKEHVGDNAKFLPVIISTDKTVLLVREQENVVSMLHIARKLENKGNMQGC